MEFIVLQLTVAEATVLDAKEPPILANLSDVVLVYWP